MPGHKVFPVDGGEVRDGLTCTYCKLMLKDPVQTSETGLRLCRECFYKARRDPNHNELDPSDEVWPDYAVEREIAKLTVKCENYQAGCDWAGLFKDLMKHLDDCQFKVIACENRGCGERVLLSELELHLKEECLHRQVQCKDCGKKMSFIELQEHTELCPNAPKVCENCKKKVPASEFLQHINECEFIKCVCGDTGFKVGSDQFYRHLEDTSKLADHLAPTITEFSKISMAFQYVAGVYQLSVRRTEELEKKVEEVEIRNKKLETIAENVLVEMERKIKELAKKYNNQIEELRKKDLQRQKDIDALKLLAVNPNADNSQRKDNVVDAASQLRDNSSQLPKETGTQLHKVIVNSQAVIQKNEVLENLLKEKICEVERELVQLKEGIPEKLAMLERDIHSKKLASEAASEHSVSSQSDCMEAASLLLPHQDSPNIEVYNRKEVTSTNASSAPIYSQIMERMDSFERQQQQTVAIIGAQQKQIEETSKACGTEIYSQITEQVESFKPPQQQAFTMKRNVASGEVVPYEKPPSSELVKQVEDKVLEVERTLNVLSVHHSELELQLQASLASTHNGAFLWRIPEVRRRIRDAKIGRITSIYSPPFYTGRNGYKMCIRAYLNGDDTGEKTHLSIFFVLMKGEYDPLLQWPFEPKVSLILVDQDHKKHLVQTFKPNAQSSSFKRPVSDMNVASGCPEFAELSILDHPSYVKEDVMYIKAIVDTSKIFHP